MGKVKVFIITFSFWAVAILVSTGLPKGEKTAVSAPLDEDFCVVLDAGHGGFDGGAVGSDGTLEKDINLEIALRLSAMLRLHGCEVVMTRSADTGTEKNPSDSISNRKKSDLAERLRIMREHPDGIFVSIHLNKFTTSAAAGGQVFYSQNNEKSKALALSVQNAIKELVQPKNNRTIKKSPDQNYLLSRAELPAVIVECGFLSNPTERELLKDSEYQSKMAFAVLCGILNYGS